MKLLVIRHGESEADLLDVHEGRADYMLSKIVSETPSDAAAAIVTHGGMVNQFYRAFLRLPVDSDIGFATGDTGIHEWRITKDRRVVIKANMTAHTEGI